MLKEELKRWWGPAIGVSEGRTVARLGVEDILRVVEFVVAHSIRCGCGNSRVVYGAAWRSKGSCTASIMSSPLLSAPPERGTLLLSAL